MNRYIRVTIPNGTSFTDKIKQVFGDYVKTNVDGSDVLPYFTSHYSIVYLGRGVEVPPQFNDEGELVSEAVYSDDTRADIYLHGGDIEANEAKVLEAFTEVNPVTPDHKIAGVQ